MSQEIPSRTQTNQRTKTVKKTLVLDIDETILCSSLWTREMRIGDTIEKKDTKATSTVEAILATIFHPDSGVRDRTFKFKDNFSLTRWVQSDYDLIFEGACCREGDDGKMTTISQVVLQRDFQPHLRTLNDLQTYNLCRPFTPISFVCNGAVVRLRPHLTEFLGYVCESFHVILFTAAPREFQETVVKYAQRSLKQALGHIPEFDKVLFREDCDKSEAGFHKNIAKLGVPLSRVAMIDDNRESFRGFEENAICIRPFCGYAGRDDELIRMKKILMKIEHCNDDIRHLICDVEGSRGMMGKNCDDEKCEDTNGLNFME